MVFIDLSIEFKVMFRLNEIVEKECQITHSNPIVIQASQFYVRVLVNLLKGQKPKVNCHTVFLDSKL